MYSSLFEEFLRSNHNLRVYEGRKVLFYSERVGLLPLFEYIRRFNGKHSVVVFDKVVGNAAALLAVKAGGREMYSPVGSQQAVATLAKYKVGYHFSEVVPHILDASGKDMCPMERLSLNRTPDEFYRILKSSPISVP